MLQENILWFYQNIPVTVVVAIKWVYSDGIRMGGNVIITKQMEQFVSKRKRFDGRSYLSNTAVIGALVAQNKVWLDMSHMIIPQIAEKCFSIIICLHNSVGDQPYFLSFKQFENMIRQSCEDSLSRTCFVYFP